MKASIGWPDEGGERARIGCQGPGSMNGRIRRPLGRGPARDDRVGSASQLRRTVPGREPRSTTRRNGASAGNVLTVPSPRP
jgi:hypothetical protein